jgi:hypothetical protein
MSVQELSVLHRRYVELSDRFRAGWTFHQFLQGLQKIALDETVVTSTRYPTDFQGVYGALKEVSNSLNASDTGRLRGQLDAVARMLGAITTALLAEDTRISPALLRQFFQRVKGYDEKILVQLVKFYIFGQSGTAWPPDRLDKADFLLTRLAEEGTSAAGIRDRNRLREVVQGLWPLFAGEPPGVPDPVSRRIAVEALRDEAAQAESLDALWTQRTIRRYRDLKHEYGDAMFEPDTLAAILDTNLTIKAKVRQLSAHEERRIFSESQLIFEMERGEGGASSGTLDQFRRDFERVEQQLQQDNLRLDDLHTLREKVRELAPRLGRPAESAVSVGPQPVVEKVRTSQFPGLGSGTEASPSDPLVAAPLEKIVLALEGTRTADTAKAVALSREIFPLRLEPREVVAYRRLAGIEAMAERPNGGKDLERFVIESAALRVRMNEQAEGIMGILDDSSTQRDSPLFASARLTSRAADGYVRRFSQAIDLAVQDGDLVEAQAFQVLRMRLIRDYSGLWLLANKN